MWPFRRRDPALNYIILILQQMETRVSAQLDALGKENQKIMATQADEKALIEQIKADIATATQSISDQIAALQAKVADGAVPDDIIADLNAIDAGVKGIGAPAPAATDTAAE